MLYYLCNPVEKNIVKFPFVCMPLNTKHCNSGIFIFMSNMYNFNVKNGWYFVLLNCIEITEKHKIINLCVKILANQWAR